MMFLILLLTSLVFSQQTNFMVYGINTNMSVIYSTNDCNFNSCPQTICNVLSNTTSAYVVLAPLEKMTYCPKLLPIFKVNMITFVFKENQQILFPVTCNTIGDCIMKSCNSFISSKESFLMAFTGQCLF